MINRTMCRGGVFIDEAEGGTADGFGDTEVPAQVLDEGGLSCAEVAAEEENPLSFFNIGVKDAGYIGQIFQVCHGDFHGAI